MIHCYTNNEIRVTKTCYPYGTKFCVIFFPYQFYDVWDIMILCYENENLDCENKKLNRNAYNELRSFLWNTCLQIKTFTLPWVQFSEKGYLR